MAYMSVNPSRGSYLDRYDIPLQAVRRLEHRHVFGDDLPERKLHTKPLVDLSLPRLHIYVPIKMK